VLETPVGWILSMSLLTDEDYRADDDDDGDDDDDDEGRGNPEGGDGREGQGQQVWICCTSTPLCPDVLMSASSR